MSVAQAPADRGASSPIPASADSTSRRWDSGLGVFIRGLLLAAFLLPLLLRVSGWLQPTSDVWVVVFIAAVALAYMVLGVGMATPDGPRTAVEGLLGILIAFLLAWMLTVVAPVNAPSPDAAPSITVTIPPNVARVGDPALATTTKPVKGRALVVTSTTDAGGIRSHTTVAVAATWQRRTDGSFVLTIARGEEDAKAIAATAALSGAQRVWLLPGN